MKCILITLALFICLLNTIFSQDYGLKFSKEHIRKNCEAFFLNMSKKPTEVQFGVSKDEFNHLFFSISNKKWLDILINSNHDGIAIEVVTKEQFACNAPPVTSKESFYKGTLLPPMFKKDLIKNSIELPNGIILVKYGVLTDELIKKDIELNLIFIQNKNVCQRMTFFDIKRYKWDLLDMGMYMDTLLSIQNPTSESSKQDHSESFTSLTKTLKFIVPFGKNEVYFTTESIKSMHDSLNATDYFIKKINIRAFSSVDGTESKNFEIQQKRAESIVKALQSYQKTEIKIDITVAENWVEFLEDIAKSSFKYMEALSKAEIKEKLKDKEVSSQLELYLKNHRKAILLIELDKITTFTDTSETEIVTSFNIAIADKNILKAKKIQDAIFRKIKEKELPTETMDKLTIPKQLEYSSLLNNSVVFKYTIDCNDLQTLQELEQLSAFFPKDPKIKYNICVLKFRLWRSGFLLVDKNKFLNEINDLKKYTIHPLWIKKMLVNYHIVASEMYMAEHQYQQKDACLNYIVQNYKHTKLDDSDLLKLAQYFVSFARADLAFNLLVPHIKKIDVSEDLLFYYLNLSIGNVNTSHDYNYKKIILNALNINRQRFCNLFDTFGKGGMTFQLLANPELKKIYCENCEGKK
jgi:outer membrane protein OmpA-like peptidoglycan-associated protein